MGRRDTIVHSIYNDPKILDGIALGEFFIPKRRSRHHSSVEMKDEILNLIRLTVMDTLWNMSRPQEKISHLS